MKAELYRSWIDRVSRLPPKDQQTIKLLSNIKETNDQDWEEWHNYSCELPVDKLDIEMAVLAMLGQHDTFLQLLHESLPNWQFVLAVSSSEFRVIFDTTSGGQTDKDIMILRFVARIPD